MLVKLLSATFLCFLLPVAPVARSTVQLMLAGHIEGEDGACIDLEIASHPSDGQELKLASLHLFLAPRTTAADVAALLTRRLDQATIGYLAPSQGPDREHASLFLESIGRISVRVTDGLRATLGVTDGVPAAVQVLPPLARQASGSVRVHGVTWDARMRQRQHIGFEVALDGQMNATGAAEAFVTACSEAQWLSEKPSHESWRPLNSLEGRELQGVNFVLLPGEGDWGLELRLPGAGQ